MARKAGTISEASGGKYFVLSHKSISPHPHSSRTKSRVKVVFVWEKTASSPPDRSEIGLCLKLRCEVFFSKGAHGDFESFVVEGLVPDEEARDFPIEGFETGVLDGIALLTDAHA